MQQLAIAGKTYRRYVLGICLHSANRCRGNAVKLSAYRGVNVPVRSTSAIQHSPELLCAY